MFDNEDVWDKYQVKVHSDEWFRFRTIGTDYYEGGVGASEVGKFIGMNKYSPVSTEVFYHKIGLGSPDRLMNDPIYWGQKMEPLILDAWQYEDLERGYAKNEMDFKETGDMKYLIRERGEANYYLVNKNYPWLFVSLDSVIPKGSRCINPKTKKWARNKDGSYYLLQKDCPLECKAMSFYSLKQWKGGMDPSYIAQVHSQMLVTGATYSEIVVLEDGRNLKILPVPLDATLAERLLNATHNFWYKKVIPGRDLVYEYKDKLGQGKRMEAERVFAEIQSLEPEPTAGQAYEDWIKDKIKDKGAQVKGNIQDYGLAQDYAYLTSLSNKIEALKQAKKNELLKRFRDLEVYKLELGKERSVGLSQSGRFTLKGIGKNVSDEAIEDIVRKITPNGSK